MLGPKPVLRFYSANTAFKAGGRQPVHIDLDCPFPGEMAFGLCVNVCLGDVGVENGATEVWLGSHLGTGWGSVGRGEHAEAIDEGLVSFYVFFFWRGGGRRYVNCADGICRWKRGGR